MGVSESFKQFCDNLKIKNLSTIQDRYSKITRRLNLDFWGADSSSDHSLYVGSFGRNTGINGISDVDMLMKFPVSIYHKYDAYSSNGQSALLQAVRASVLKTYTGTECGGDGQVVVVPFTQRPIVEILPAFLNTDKSTFTFPDSNGGGSWKVTNPRAEILAMRKHDAECNKNLKRLCRMMRVWKQHNSVPITGFLIDVLAYQFIANWTYRDKSYHYYDFMVRDFLTYLANRDPKQQYWLAPGSNQHVVRIGAFERRAKASYDQALAAIGYQDQKRWSTANNKWREVFGSRYTA